MYSSNNDYQCIIYVHIRMVMFYVDPYICCRGGGLTGLLWKQARYMCCHSAVHGSGAPMIMIRYPTMTMMQTIMIASLAFEKKENS